MIDPSKIEAMISRFEAIEADMATGPDPEEYVKLAKEYSDMEPVVKIGRIYNQKLSEIEDLKSLLGDP
jgi:peptide chain release factor 1